jgi:deoxyhypusine synthase
MAIHSKTTGAILLGGGCIKHHVLNSNIWKNGLDYAVFINTAIEKDASDSGAQISEAITWGKVKL